MRSTIGNLTANIYHARLTLSLIKREFKLRFLGSLFGKYWNFIHPLAMIGIYTIVFSKVMKARLGVEAGPFDFTLYLCAGLLPWNCFSEIISRSATTFQENANFIKKIAFPKEILQSVICGVSFLNLLISLSIYLSLYLLVHQKMPPQILWLPITLICHFLFTAGLGMIVSVFNVFFKDTQQMVTIGLQVWFWLTPVVYLINLVPEQFQYLLAFNPMFHIISLYQAALFYQAPVQLSLAAYAFFFAAASFIIGAYTLDHFKEEIADEI